MKLATSEDISIPLDRVFQLLSDFEYFERLAIRRGAELERVGSAPRLMVGMAWKARFNYRGSERKATVRLTAVDRPNSLCIEGHGQGIGGELSVELLALSPRQTRLNFELEVQPRSLSGKLIVQSLKLAKGKLRKRFKRRMGELVDSLQSRDQQTA